MEPLTSHLGLRSTESGGRPLGTERSSVPFEFPRPSEGTRDLAVDRLAARIRGGRTDAADAVPERAPAAREGDVVRDERRAADRDLTARRAARESEQTGSERPSVQSEPAPRTAPETSAGSSDVAPRAPESAAQTANEAESSAAAIYAAPFGPQATLAVTASAPASALAAQPVIQANRGPVAPVPVALAGGRSSGATGLVTPATARPTTSASGASAPAATASSARSADVQRAEAVLEQLRVRIQSGDREATIELRPGDLGRIRMHVRTEGASVTALIGAESPETLAVLEAHAPELRAWLARDGTEEVELRLELLGDANRDPRNDGEGRGDRDARHGESAHSRTNAHATVAPEAVVRALGLRSADGGVDLVA
ncbi:MAG: flagellar hook-length control protein FliK [Planctomycetota bacterium]